MKSILCFLLLCLTFFQLSCLVPTSRGRYWGNCSYDDATDKAIQRGEKQWSIGRGYIQLFIPIPEPEPFYIYNKVLYKRNDGGWEKWGVLKRHIRGDTNHAQRFNGGSFNEFCCFPETFWEDKQFVYISLCEYRIFYHIETALSDCQYLAFYKISKTKRMIDRKVGTDYLEYMDQHSAMIDVKDWIYIFSPDRSEDDRIGYRVIKVDKQLNDKIYCSYVIDWNANYFDEIEASISNNEVTIINRGWKDDIKNNIITFNLSSLKYFDCTALEGDDNVKTKIKKARRGKEK